MSVFGEAQIFGGYLIDSGASIVGVKTNFASQAELSTGDVSAGNTAAPPEEQAAEQAALAQDIQGSETTTLAEQNKQLGLPTNGLIDLVPGWVWWVAGGVGLLAALAILAPYVGLIPKGKS